MHIRRTYDTARAEAGFTVLLAAIVASLVLSLGISVFSIAQKQLILSSTGRNSQYAFYAADTAAECALYWDVRYSYFGTTTPADPPAEDVTCDDQQLNPAGYPGSDSYPYTISFQFEPNGFCAQVQVTKANVPGEPRTLIRADGYSDRCELIETSPRILQRSVELSY
jgi:hypothetical protein